MSQFLDELKNNKSHIFRRAYIKRRLATTGLFEDDWVEISEDVKKWGVVTQKIDDIRQGKIKFSSTNLKVANDEGRYNPEDNENSLWFGYASQQRTLFKIESGFKKQTLTSEGIYVNTETQNSLWDMSLYDENLWDDTSVIYTGILQGDININDKNEVALKAMPLSQVFRDYPARNLTGWTSTGMTASEFMTMLRDQTDGSANFIFRPFFGDTTSNWNISTTTVTYPQLNTSTAKDIIDKNVWDVIERLAEAENYVAYVDNTGQFNFIDKDAGIASSTTYEFHGIGSTDRDYGIQIKGVQYFGFRQSKYYSRVQVKHTDSDTESSYELRESTYQVSGGNSAWNFGHRTVNIENFWLDATTASTIADQVFNNVSSAKKELVFTSSYVPQLNINDRLTITYDSNPINASSFWDLNDWADTAGASETGQELIWDPFLASSINLLEDEYKPLSIAVDLDRLETKIIAKEI